jgi:predicted DNA-binding transcriptional regulator AlpA
MAGTNQNATVGANAGGGAFLQGAARELPAMLSVDDVGVLLACSSRHVYRLADMGRMPRPVKLGALVRWPRSTGNPMTGILDWVAAGCPNCRNAGAK